MRRDITVAAEVRNSRGKNEARRVRAAGRIPAVLYGSHRRPVPVAVDPREISKIVHGSSGFNTIFNIAVTGGETTPVMLVDRQVDPVTSRLLHADFKRVDLSKRLRVSVPVHYLRAKPRGSRYRADCWKSSRAPSKSNVFPTIFPSASRWMSPN